MARRAEGLSTLEDYVLRSGLSRRGLELLAEADAFRALGLSRREALWAVKGMADEVGAERTAPLIARQSVKEAQVQLPFMTLPKEVAEDYRTTSLSLKDHPVSFFREDLAQMGVVPFGRARFYRAGQETESLLALVFWGCLMIPWFYAFGFTRKARAYFDVAR